MPIRTGLAGFGHAGRYLHAPFLSELPCYTLRKVHARHIPSCAPEYPDIIFTNSFDELLADVDLIVLALPNALHESLAEKALRAGKHVLTDKPAAVSASAVCRLGKLADSLGLVYTVYQNRRYDGDFLTIREIKKNELLGRIHTAELRWDRYSPGISKKEWKAAGGPGIDILYDLGIHMLDQAYLLFGCPREVYASLSRQKASSPGIDSFSAELYYDGLTCRISAGELYAFPGPRFALFGEKGAYVKRGADPQEAFLLNGGNPSDPSFGVTPPEEDGLLYTIRDNILSCSRYPTLKGDYACFYTSLASCLSAGDPPPVPYREAAAVLNILETCICSDAQGKRLPIKQIGENGEFKW